MTAPGAEFQEGSAHRGYVVGVDIGGTFTDCAIIGPTGAVHTGKVPTRPSDRAQSFFESIEEAAAKFGLSLTDLLQSCERLMHGTTTGTNALVTRSGARVGLLTTVGHADVTHMMKGSGRLIGLSAEEMLNAPRTDKPVPITPKDFIGEVTERVDFEGDVVIPFDDETAAAAVRQLRAQETEAIAISFLWSIRNADHERRAREITRSEYPEAFVSCASDLSSRVGEYERTMTCVINSYIGPLMTRYVEAIEKGAEAHGFRGRILYTQCAGGAITAREAQEAPIRTVDSGPVSGAVGSAFLASKISEPDVIITDMGGTSFDVSVIRGGQPDVREISMISRFEMALPRVHVESIGAGGGSIAWIDDSRRLQVGPQSAGADPGPPCYGRGGTEPTVTDADLVLGMIDPENFLHGAMKLDAEASKHAIGQLAERLGLGLYETAAGINRIVDSNMADLLRRMSVMRGLDPREFLCFAFGGAGPQHAGAFAREVRVKKVIVPLVHVAPVWSAFGAATADVSHVYQRWESHDMPADATVINTVFAELERQARYTLADEGFDESRISLRRAVHMKYRTQVNNVEVPVSLCVLDQSDVRATEANFHRIYDDLYGKGAGYVEAGCQIAGFVLRASAGVAEPPLAAQREDAQPWSGSRPVYWDELGGFEDTPVLRMTGGRVTDAVIGPLLIELPDTVVVVRPGQRGTFDALGNFMLEV